MLDALVSATLLVALAPVLGALALLVRAIDGRPVLFVQARVGVGGRIFRLHKFRTMAAAHASAASDGARLTSLGRFLRSVSLDELPQLWDVLRGSMSLVGPRPLLPAYLDRYTLEQARRHEVVPGMTGLVQVSGRNALTWEEKFALDVWYVDHWSFALDLRILARTALALLRRDGIAAPGAATMPEFLGSQR
jgi:lipopolysaccharide/colanic/teichoic acid biosynthesis glycosyltransferase